MFCSYVDSEGRELVLADDFQNSIQFSTGGELIIARRGKKGISNRILGSREFLRYYRQKPRPTSANDVAIVSALAARFESRTSHIIYIYRNTYIISLLTQKRKRKIEGANCSYNLLSSQV